MGLVRIMKVTKVDYAFAKKRPPDLLIDAEGEVPTGGWMDGQLGPWFYITPPEDGVQDFDFIAESPTGPAPDVVSPITATTNIVDIDVENYWGANRPLTGIRVHATENSMEVIFGKSS